MSQKRDMGHWLRESAVTVAARLICADVETGQLRDRTTADFSISLRCGRNDGGWLEIVLSHPSGKERRMDGAPVS